jgi:lysophospholipase
MNQMLLSGLFLILNSGSAFALPAYTLDQDFKNVVLPYIEHNISHAEFAGVDSKRLHFISITNPHPRGVIILSPGQGEAAVKYSEFLYDMKDSGFDFFVLDHRGQGESERLLPDPIKSHVEHFSDYVSDFSQFVLQVVKPQNYPSSFILAHSMGGAIATGFSIQHPHAVTGIILLSPMIEINTGKYKYGTADLLAKALDVIGLGSHYAPGQKPYDPNSLFANNTVTSSPERFRMKKIC